jgi:hypothetical protein
VLPPYVCRCGCACSRSSMRLTVDYNAQLERTKQSAVHAIRSRIALQPSTARKPLLHRATEPVPVRHSIRLPVLLPAGRWRRCGYFSFLQHTYVRSVLPSLFLSRSVSELVSQATVSFAVLLVCCVSVSVSSSVCEAVSRSVSVSLQSASQ